MERLERKYSIRLKRLNVVIEELKQRITAIAVKKLEGIRDGYIVTDKTVYFKVIKGSFIGSWIRKKKYVMMISLSLANWNSSAESYGVSLQIIRRMQNGHKTCEVKLMLKNRRR